MNKRWLISATVIIVVIGLAGGVWLWMRDDDNLETMQVQIGSIDLAIQTVGTIQVSDEILIRTLSGGSIERFGAEVGDAVEAGDILAEIDRSPFENAVADANRELIQAEFNLQFAERRAGEAPEDESRLSDLLFAREQLDSAQQAFAEAESAVANTVVLAPEDGIVLELLADKGELTTASQPVVRMYAPENIALTVEIDELDVPTIAPGTEVHFRLDAYPSLEILGTVERTSPEARNQSGATLFTAIVNFAPPPGLMVRPGMNATVSIVTDARSAVLVVPAEAITTVGSRTFVSVLENGTIEEREIVVGYSGSGLTEVVSGLTEGEVVILNR